MRKPTISPSMLDKAIAAISPAWGVSRLQSRAHYTALTGGYIGARRDRRQTSSWQPGGGSADADILPDLETLRERSRDLTRNAPLALGAINTVVTKVVGEGLKLQSSIDADFLGLTQKQAEEWQTNTEREFRLWAGTPECDASRSQAFGELQALAFRSVLESGDVFPVMRYLDRPGSPYGLKIQTIEADRISNPSFKADGSAAPETGNPVYGGIEQNAETGAPVAIWMMKTHPGSLMPGSRTWSRMEVFGRRSGMRQVLHLFERTRPGQTRGIPYLAPVIEPLKQLDRYAEAEVMAAVVGAMFTVFVKTESKSGLDVTATNSETGAKSTDDDVKLASGQIVDLGPNESIETASPGRPNQAFDPFVMAVLRQVGVALELPFEVLIKHYTASYSAARAAILEAWHFFRRRRAWLAARYCQPIYEAFLLEAVARGRVVAPGFAGSVAVRQAWCGAQWVGPGMGSIDPKKENEAYAIAEDRGWQTASEITAEKTGGDFDRNIRRRKHEESRRADAGLSNSARPAPAALPEPEDDPQDGPDQPEQS